MEGSASAVSNLEDVPSHPCLPQLITSAAFKSYLSKVTEPYLPKATVGSSFVPGNPQIAYVPGFTGWGGLESRCEDRCLEEDMAALAERVAASMLDDDSWSSSGSEQNASTPTSENGSPKFWHPGCKGFPFDSRPSSPTWSSSSSCEHDHPSPSYDEQDSWGTPDSVRSPNSVLSSRRTPFRGGLLSQSELTSLQQQLENLNAVQLQALKKALAESQAARRAAPAQGRRKQYGKGERCRGRNLHHSEQVRKQADRRAISALANAQPNERLAPQSRASRRGVISGAAAPPQSIPKAMLPAAAPKEGGTGVFLPMVTLPSGAGRNKAVPAPVRPPPRSMLAPVPKPPSAPPRRGPIPQQRNQFPQAVVSSPPKVAVVDCRELTRIPVVNFNQRAATHVAPEVRGHWIPSQALGNYNRQFVDSHSRGSRALYVSHREFVPQQSSHQSRSQKGNSVDSLGLPEEWVY